MPDVRYMIHVPSGAVEFVVRDSMVAEVGHPGLSKFIGRPGSDLHLVAARRDWRIEMMMSAEDRHQREIDNASLALARLKAELRAIQAGR